MKKIIILFAFLLPTFSFSQSQLEIFSSLDFTDNHYGLENKNIRSFTKGKLNSHFGINYNQKIKEKLWLEIGLGYSSLGNKTKLISELRFGSQHDGNGNYDPTLPGEFDDFQAKYNYQYLEIPIAMRYEFSKRKIKPFVEVGFSTMYFLQTVTKGFTNKKRTSTSRDRIDDISEIQFASLLSFGFSYAVNENLEFLIQPNFRFNLTTLNKNVPTKQYHWSAGLAVGVRLGL